MDTKDEIRERKKLCFDGWFYSAQRIDLLIISISGAGVYTILETLKNSLSHPTTYLLNIKMAGVLFVVSIILNLVSQFTGKKANYEDMTHCIKKLRASEPPTTEQMDEIAHHDNNAERYTNLTNSLNIASMVGLFLGLILLVVFFSISF